MPAVSVVVRAKDEAATIGRVLDLLEAQVLDGGEAQRIVVDSGSRDETPAIARDRGAQLIEVPAAEFTFGRALNVGADAARAPVVVALSADAFPLDPGWLARVVSTFDDPAVACASGDHAGPDHAPLAGPLRQDGELARRFPFWGYSNAAGGFRADLWRRRPFREDLPGCEDKEWSSHWLQQGHVAVIDPALAVEHDHSRGSLPYSFRRGRRESEGFAMYLDLPAQPPTAFLRSWFSSDLDRFSSPWRARLDPWRGAYLLGDWVGRRRGAARRSG